MQEADIAGRWDAEYRSGRYLGEAPVAFVADVVDAARRHRLADDLGLYVGCGNGRNYIPLVDAGLDLIGLDVSAAAISQLTKLLPDRAGRLIHGDLGSLPAGSQFGTVVAIQVFQHGGEADAHRHIRAAIGLLRPGGLVCVRVNAVSTQIEYRHEIVETNGEGGFTIAYRDGPKEGLLIHFFARRELERLTSELEPIMPLRCDRTHRQPPARGHWDQWEAIWRAPAD